MYGSVRWFLGCLCEGRGTGAVSVETHEQKIV